ncbi:MAG: beta-ketoacyl synthase N-terminal-like domain-containing protein [Candidatus Paracaedibacteraceae bacterium]|nr:beta-ketoacyl synthase N-terminal-like domain-containing protein [Candidatus Paracaedibacteraceae bacterium]
MIRNNSKDIAVLGVSARLPGPRELDDWWSSLLKGEELTTRLTKEELRETGVPEFLINDPEYIPVRGYLVDANRFDHKVFRVNHRDAEMMDPQHRLMLETAWCALEDAGYGKSNAANRPVTGVFASGSGSGYARAMLSQGPLEPDFLEQIIHGNEPDFIASLIAYKLNLTGPAVSIQTACSSSLVSLHLACQALNNGDCEQAIVVAAGIAFPQGGYLHIPGGINSESGICRPFDEKADGVVEGSGVACVVLRRLISLPTEAPEIYGVILGTAINNDGSAKAGYFSPSISGQISVIQQAIHNANIEASSIGYLETHGTGTRIGDPIEWTATSEAYKGLGASKGQIAIGALKANIGHLDSASGLASLIKTMKVLKEGKIPPLANFDTLNPFMEKNDSPLCVQNNKEHLWPNLNQRRAAISAFGIGGTNAHIILEQAPQTEHEPAKNEDSFHIIQLSAADLETLNCITNRLSNYLIKNDPNLKNVAYTLTNGRTEFTERLVVCGRTSKEIAEKLNKNEIIHRRQAPINGPKPAIFLFTGQGSQRPGMAKAFANTLPGFLDNIETCIQYLEENLKITVKRALFDDAFPEEEMNQTVIAQPALFVLGYAIGKSLLSLGIKPAGVAGHSLGEVTAAYFSGILSLEDAVKFVVERGKSMQNCPQGAMLAVNMSAFETTELLRKSRLNLCISAINTTNGCVVSGTVEEIQIFKNNIGKTARSTILKTNRAFHSPLIESALTALKSTLSKINMQPTKIPIALNVTGQIYNKGHKMPSDYFVDQAKKPVYFLDSLQVMHDFFQEPIFIEIGTGQTLSSMAWSLGFEALPMNPNHSEEISIDIMTSIGALWTYGYPVNLSYFCTGGKAIHLPTYPFYGPKWMAPEVTCALKKNHINSKEPASSNDNHEANNILLIKQKDVKAVLLSLWSNILGCDNIKDESNFFSLGGDSLLITSLIRKVNQSFNIKVPARKMLVSATLKDQVTLIQEQL